MLDALLRGEVGFGSIATALSLKGMKHSSRGMRSAELGHGFVAKIRTL